MIKGKRGEKVEYRFTICGVPIPKARPRLARGGHAYTPERTREYEEHVLNCFYEVYRKDLRLKCPLEVYMKFYLPIPKGDSKAKRKAKEEGIIRPTKKPDCDNLIKAVSDALNGHLYEDDSQIIKVSGEKFYSEKPRCEVVIYGEDEPE